MSSIHSYPITDKAFASKTVNLVCYLVPSGRERSKPKELSHKFEGQNVPKMIYPCDEIGEFAVLAAQTIMFFDSKSGAFKRKIEFKTPDLVRCKVPRGTKVMMVFSPKHLYFISLETFKIIQTESLLVANDEQWKYFFNGTNKFIT
jgi:hypothetical protein